MNKLYKSLLLLHCLEPTIPVNWSQVSTSYSNLIILWSPHDGYSLFVVAWCSVPSSEQIISLVGFIWTNRGWFSDQNPWELICHHLSLDCLHPQISLISPISSSQHKHMLCWSPVKMNLVRIFFLQFCDVAMPHWRLLPRGIVAKFGYWS
jgi:hypothetical protein